MAKLNMWVADKATLVRYQNWLIGSCIACLDAYSQCIVTSLLTGSLLPEQTGSSANETITVSLNGKPIQVVSMRGHHHRFLKTVQAG
jgi:hypothetical protein